MDLNLEDIKRQVDIGMHHVQNYEQKIKEQQDVIKQLEQHYKSIKMQHVEVMSQLNQQLQGSIDQLTNDDYLLAIKQVIKDQIEHIEQRSDDQIRCIIDENQPMMKKKTEKTALEISEEQNITYRNQYRKSYLLQLQSEKEQLNRQLVLIKQENTMKQQKVNELQIQVDQIKADLRNVVSDDFLDEQHLFSKQTQFIDDGRSMTEFSMTQQTAYIQQSPQQQSSNHENQSRIQNSEIHIVDETTNSFFDYTVQPTTTNNNKKKTTLKQQLQQQLIPKKNIHIKCQQDVENYNKQILALKNTLNQMKNELKVVTQETIQCLRQCGLIDNVYVNNQVNLSESQKHALVDSMGRNRVLVQALMRLGQFKHQHGGIDQTKTSIMKQNQ